MYLKEFEAFNIYLKQANENPVENTMINVNRLRRIRDNFYSLIYCLAKTNEEKYDHILKTMQNNVERYSFANEDKLQFAYARIELITDIENVIAIYKSVNQLVT